MKHKCFDIDYNIDDEETLEQTYHNHAELKKLNLPKTNLTKREVLDFSEKIDASMWYQIHVCKNGIDYCGDDDIIWHGNLDEFVMFNTA